VDADEMTAAVVRGGPRLHFYGGKLCENMIQAMARDVFAEGLLRVEAAGFNPILTVHDEVVCELPEATAAAALPEIIRLMTVAPAWAPDLPLAAEGVVTEILPEKVTHGQAALPYHPALMDMLQTQPPKGRGHQWLFRFALHFRHYHSEAACFRLLRACADEWRDRQVPDEEVWKAVRKAYSATTEEAGAVSAIPWPAPSPDAIARVLSATESAVRPRPARPVGPARAARPVRLRRTGLCVGYAQPRVHGHAAGGHPERLSATSTSCPRP
jgi:hypothetical protein